MPNSNPFTILTATMVVITMLMISSYPLVSGTSFTASSTENATFMTGRDIKAGILASMSGSNVTNFELFSNGTAIATFTGNHSGAKVYYNHSMTPESGFAFENGTIYLPDGSELRILLE